MRRFITALVLSSVLVTTFPAAYAQRAAEKPKSKKAAVSITAQRGVDTIAAAQLRDYLTFVASDEMEGRDTPSRGLDTTAKFLAMNLSRWGLKPGGDNGTYFQRIALQRVRIAPAGSSVEINGQGAKFGDDFLAQNVSGTAIAPLIFVGHGWVI